ncbi:TIR domain-containing protein [Actinomadura hibisca]|uniref:TIR domain-containing protein n=1 Tax=Actinomadura hibisca TaxID=68565 RepID=UPI00083740FC|nr:TIR domain-containing protein [Actinomadura hibisca]
MNAPRRPDGEPSAVAPRPTAPPDGVRFDAFLSYARQDEAVCEELHRALARFVKPWYRTRALRIFRDRAVLPAGPGLRSSLHDHLRRSRALIVLASPAAARSRWVEEEIAFWRRERGRAPVFVVVVAGRIGWDDALGDFARDRTDCLPEAAHGLFAEEPLWGDLRGIAPERLRAEPRFVQAVADIAAPLHGRPKDEMFGEEVRQRRRFRRVVTATVAALTVLAVAAVAAAVVAVRQRDTAERRAAIAESREMAAHAADLFATDPHGGAALAARAVRRHATSEAVEALRQGLGLDHVRAVLRGDGAIGDVALSPDGRQMAYGDSRGQVYLWDVPGRTARRLATRPATVITLAFDAAGRRLAVGDGDGGAALVDLRTGAATELRGHDRRPVRIVEFAPGGDRVLTTGDDETGRLWDAATGRQLSRFADTASFMDAPHFSARGGLVLAREPERVVVRDAATGDQVSALEHPSVSVATFSPDGRTVVTGGFDTKAMLWEARTGHRKAELSGHGDPVRGVAFSSSGALVATAADSPRMDTDFTARVWNAGDGRAVATLRGHTAAVRRVLFLNDREVATASYDGTARLWDGRSGAQHTVLAGHTRNIWDAAADRDGRLLATASEDGTVRLWAADADRPRFTAELPGGAEDAGFLPDGRLLVVGPQEARVIGADDGRTLATRRLAPAPGGVRLEPHLRVSPDRRRVGVDANGLVTTFDTATGRWTADLPSETGFYSYNAVDRKVTRAVTFPAGREPPQVRELPGGRVTARLAQAVPHLVSAVVFSPDGRYVAVGQIDGQTLVFDAGDGRLRWRLPPAKDRVFTMAFNADSTALVTGGGQDLERNSQDSSARVYDLRTGRLRATLTGHIEAIRSAAFSPDGRLVATAAQDDTARLWDARSGRQIHLLRGHAGQVWTAEFGPDGAFLLTSGSDRTARIWRVATGQPAGVLRGHGHEVRSAHFAPGGRQVVTTSLDRGARVFDCPLLGDADTLLKVARGRGLT